MCSEASMYGGGGGGVVGGVALFFVSRKTSGRKIFISGLIYTYLIQHDYYSRV